MLFNSATYAVFFVLVLALNWALWRRTTARLALLLAASYYFYGCWSWRFLGLILFSTALDYAVGLFLGERATSARSRAARRVALGVSLAGNLGVLAFFKYWNFFAGEAVALVRALGLEAGPVFTDVVLPVGISFYTFQTLSYTIDVYRGNLSPERSLLRFALFVAFFPQLVAGPIVRASEFLPQLRELPKVDQRGLERGLTLVFFGLVKKVLVADVLGRALVDPFWADPGAYGGWRSLLAVYGYAFQIYGDFSGYSDMAIGSAALLGYDLGLNFRSPYRAASAREFWTRWHISLSSWLRDYLYIPLGGNRLGPWRTYRNLLVTMLLGGLWHGAAWTFVVWGAFHGGYLAVERALGVGEPRTRAGLWLRRALTFHLVCVGWVFFRSRSASEALAVFASLARGVGTAIPTTAWLALAFAAAVHFPPRAWKERLRRAFVGLPSVAQGAVYAGVIALVVVVQRGERPFIYFQF